MRKRIPLRKIACASAVQVSFIPFGLCYLCFDDAKVVRERAVFFRSGKKVLKKSFPRKSARIGFLLLNEVKTFEKERLPGNIIPDVAFLLCNLRIIRYTRCGIFIMQLEDNSLYQMWKTVRPSPSRRMGKAVLVIRNIIRCVLKITVVTVRARLYLYCSRPLSRKSR